MRKSRGHTSGSVDRRDLILNLIGGTLLLTIVGLVAWAVILAQSG